jgi:hypothetical protein
MPTLLLSSPRATIEEQCLKEINSEKKKKKKKKKKKLIVQRRSTTAPSHFQNPADRGE